MGNSITFKTLYFRSECFPKRHQQNVFDFANYSLTLIPNNEQEKSNSAEIRATNVKGAGEYFFSVFDKLMSADVNSTIVLTMN